MDTFQPDLPGDISITLRSLEERLTQRIYKSTKTGLQNFDAFEALWPKMAGEPSTCLLFVEVDKMKRLNNEFGHENADRFLQALGDILDKFNSSDTYSFHVSGDEFLVVVCNRTNEKVSELTAQILHKVRACRVAIENNAQTFAVSIGIYKIDPSDSVEVSKAARDFAEDAVKEAKRNGGNQYCWFTPDMMKQAPQIDIAGIARTVAPNFHFQ